MEFRKNSSYRREKRNTRQKEQIYKFKLKIFTRPITFYYKFLSYSLYYYIIGNDVHNSYIEKYNTPCRKQLSILVFKSFNFYFNSFQIQDRKKIIKLLKTRKLYNILSEVNIIILITDKNSTHFSILRWIDNTRVERRSVERSRVVPYF